MGAARYAFAFISVILLGCALATYLGHPRDGSSYAVPIFLAVCGAITTVVAWNIDRWLRQPHKSFDGEDVGDLAMRDHNHQSHGHDVDMDE
jgi:hypothetical protein